MGLQTHNKNSSAGAQSSGRLQQTSGKLESVEKAHMCAHTHSKLVSLSFRNPNFFFSCLLTCTDTATLAKWLILSMFPLSGCLIAESKGTCLYLCTWACVRAPLYLRHKIRLIIKTLQGGNHTRCLASVETVLAGDHRSGAAGSGGRLMNWNPVSW